MFRHTVPAIIAAVALANVAASEARADSLTQNATSSSVGFPGMGGNDDTMTGADESTGAAATDAAADATGADASADAAATQPAGVDEFGVTMLYPTKDGGETWALGADANRDPRFDPQDPVTLNEDGSWKMTESQVRMHAMTSSGYQDGGSETNRDVLAERGYMQSPNDWKNVEMTGFVKVNETEDLSENFAWYARGGRHSDDIACEGSAYKGDLHYDGTFRVAKETWHVSYQQGEYGEKSIEPIVGRWVGFKTVIRNVEQNGVPAVKTELWVNDNADQVTWEKMYEIVDDGSMGGDSDQCGASDPTLPLTWGGPLATFRWDGTSDVDFKWLSVREID